MHPILGSSGRLPIYLAGWLPVGLLLTLVFAETADAGVWLALALAIPLSQVYAFVCLAAWYPSRAVPLHHSNAWRVVGTHSLAAAFSSLLWQVAAMLWAFVLAYVPLFVDAHLVIAARQRELLVFGILLYVLSAAGSYLFAAFETSYEAEKRALEAQKTQELAAQELELARSLQKRLLPSPSHQARGMALAARNLAALSMAGDFFDYFQLGGNSWRLVVADVAGKGLAASLITATVKGMLPPIASDRDLVETLRELNRRLAPQLASREFVALALARYDLDSGRLELLNAGLPDPYLIRADGSLQTLEAPMPRLPLGIRAEVPYESLVVDLEIGDRVLFLTDGLPEAPVTEGEPLGYEALPGFLTTHSKDLDGWLDDLLDRLQAATLAPLDDDWTALVIERTPRQD